MITDQNDAITRRGFFRTAGAVGAVVATSGLLGVPTRAAWAEAAPVGEVEEAVGVDMDAIIAEHMGAGSVTMGKVSLNVPDVAENAMLVRMPIVVDHPMEADNYIQSVALFIDNNPSPFIAQFEFAPESGKAAMEFKVRMAKPSKVRVIAKTNKGQLYGLVKPIKVAAGGCAG